MYITRIKIKNFRSLVDVEIFPKNYTVFAGANDSGKSNVLRALNLFFNGQTDIGKNLVFSQDYAQQAVIRANKAKEILVELEFSPPSNYTDNQPVVWRKFWREGSILPYHEQINMINGEAFSPRSRTEYWIRQIAYEYVPAIRGNEFFATLKRRLHNTLAETIAPKLATASGRFLSSIRKEVVSIEQEARRLFDLQTEFSLPSDLGSLFEILDLKTADKHAATPLQNRGDGIQGRHIPVILRFLAEQRKINFARGKPSPETIFGYEEPENNLELSKQIEEADEFYRSSNSIQVLLTTHSPAFYSVTKSQALASAWYAVRAAGSTSFQNSATTQSLDAGLGLMPFIEPYLHRAANDRAEMLEELNKLHSQSLHVDKAVICVEGSTDKKVIDAACSVLFTSPLPFEVVAKTGMGAGTNWVVGYAIARAILPDLKTKTAVLFDNDQAGIVGADLLTLRLKAIDCAGKVKYFKIGKDNADDELRKIIKAGFNISMALEEICGAGAWDYAESKDWLEDRTDVIKQNAGDLTINQTFDDLINAKIKDPNCQRLIKKRLNFFKKDKFSSYVAEQIISTKIVPPTLEVLINKIHEHFSN
ncbi:hypothetical protein WX98_17115 [Pseudomonas syringae pv. persicae]|nr:hypothetical protein WX98_17115 [Pseudomonas syringae pv. persicae]